MSLVSRYLNAKHPTEKQGVINSLIHRAKTASELEHLQDELQQLRSALEMESKTTTYNELSKEIRRPEQKKK